MAISYEKIELFSVLLRTQMLVNQPRIIYCRRNASGSLWDYNDNDEVAGKQAKYKKFKQMFHDCAILSCTL